MTGELAFPLAKTIFDNDVIDDLAAEDASPAIKIFGDAKKLLVDHDTAASIALHLFTLLIIVD